MPTMERLAANTHPRSEASLIVSWAPCVGADTDCTNWLLQAGSATFYHVETASLDLACACRRSATRRVRLRVSYRGGSYWQVQVQLCDPQTPKLLIYTSRGEQYMCRKVLTAMLPPDTVL